MKKIISFVLLVMACIAINARTFVLVTGVSNYEGEVNDLAQSTKDAKSFYNLMRTQTNDITILTSRNANKQNIKSKLSTIMKAAKSGDRIIFYFAGHGGPGVIYPYDGEFAYSELVSLLKGSKASEKILIIDACHSGSASTDISKQSITEKDGIICLMGCRPSEYSGENSLIGAGYFTQGIIKGLRGKADDNKDRKITLYELFKYAYNDVVTRTKEAQHPQLIAPKSTFETVITKW